MSKFVVKKPIVHIPNFKEYSIAGERLYNKLIGLGFTIPFPMRDNWYYYISLEDWGRILLDLTFNSNLYKEDKFDCDDMAIKAYLTCRERYGINTLAAVDGDTPQGRHAFNMLYYGDGFMLFEPNDGFPFSGLAFEIGENDYHPELILI